MSSCDGWDNNQRNHHFPSHPFRVFLFLALLLSHTFNASAGNNNDERKGPDCPSNLEFAFNTAVAPDAVKLLEVGVGKKLKGHPAPLPLEGIGEVTSLELFLFTALSDGPNYVESEAGKRYLRKLAGDKELMMALTQRLRSKGVGIQADTALPQPEDKSKLPLTIVEIPNELPSEMEPLRHFVEKKAGQTKRIGDVTSPVPLTIPEIVNLIIGHEREKPGDSPLKQIFKTRFIDPDKPDEALVEYLRELNEKTIAKARGSAAPLEAPGNLQASASGSAAATTVSKPASFPKIQGKLASLANEIAEGKRDRPSDREKWEEVIRAAVGSEPLNPAELGYCINVVNTLAAHLSAAKEGSASSATRTPTESVEARFERLLKEAEREKASPVKAEIATSGMTEDLFRLLRQKIPTIAASLYPDHPISSIHLLYFLLAEQVGDRTLGDLIRKRGGDPNLIKTILEEKIRTYKIKPKEVRNLPTEEIQKILLDALAKSQAFGDKFLGIQFLAVALAASEGEAGQILRNAGYTAEDLASTIQEVRGSFRITNQNPRLESAFSALGLYTDNWTEAGARGDFDGIEGVDDKVLEIFEISNKKGGRAPVALGEPGTGKTATLQRAAALIGKDQAGTLSDKERAADPVPTALKGALVLRLDLDRLVGGTSLRGEFENRKNALFAGIKFLETNGVKVILVIDEFHRVLGTGKSDGGGADFSQGLLEPIENGQLNVWAATTTDWWDQKFGKRGDEALGSRLTPVYIPVPDDDRVDYILRNVSKGLENRHKVAFSKDALRAARELTNRYHEGYQPRKGIKVIQMAASAVEISKGGTAGLQVLQQMSEMDALLVKRSNIENEVAAQRMDPLLAEQQIKKIDQKLHEAHEQLAVLEAGNEYRKMIEAEMNTLSKRIQESEKEVIRLINAGKKAEAEELNRTRVEAALEEWNRFARPTVSKELIEGLVAKVAGFSVQEIRRTLKDRIKTLKEDMKKYLIGQDEVIERIYLAMQSVAADLRDPDNHAPINTFVFAGDSGAGKNFAANLMQRFLFPNASADQIQEILISGTDYKKEHDVAALTGAPPGYVGYEEGGRLIKAVKKRPYSMVVFDEIENFHPSILDILVQICQSGKLADKLGNIASFRNTIVVLITNIGMNGSIDFPEGITLEEKRKLVIAEIRGRLDRKIMDRIGDDNIILFNSLTLENYTGIAALQIENLVRIVRMNHQAGLSVSDAAITEIARLAKEHPLGSPRDIIREIQDKIINRKLAPEILSGSGVYRGGTFHVDFKAGNFTVEFTPGEPQK